MPNSVSAKRAFALRNGREPAASTLTKCVRRTALLHEWKQLAALQELDSGGHTLQIPAPSLTACLKVVQGGAKWCNWAHNVRCFT